MVGRRPNAAPSPGPGRGLHAGRPHARGAGHAGRLLSRRGADAAPVGARPGRALLAPDSELDARFAYALVPSVETTGPFDRARTELLYGSRLARAGRTVDAAHPLSAALRALEELGAGPWANRTREEIVAAGGAPPDPQVNRLGATDAARARRRARRGRRRTGRGPSGYGLTRAPRIRDPAGHASLRS